MPYSPGRSNIPTFLTFSSAYVPQHGTKGRRARDSPRSESSSRQQLRNVVMTAGICNLSSKSWSWSVNTRVEEPGRTVGNCDSIRTSSPAGAHSAAFLFLALHSETLFRNVIRGELSAITRQVEREEHYLCKSFNTSRMREQRGS